MKIVLADPPERGTNYYNRSFPNLGILYLISSIEAQYKDAEVYYLNTGLSLQAHINAVKKIKPIIYGISFASPYASLGYQVIRELKNYMPNLPIICGGPLPSAEPEEVLLNSKADFCCIGEGEVTICELLQCILENGILAKVKGLAYKDHKDQVRINPNRPYVENLDDLPIPAWDKIKIADYQGSRRSMGKLSTMIVVSRGCPYKCVFCSNPVWKIQKPWVRIRSPENIVKEVEYLYKRGVRDIYLQADEMNIDIKWCIEVFDSLKELAHDDLYFQCNLRAHPVTADLVNSMKRAHCWLVHLGIESGSQRVLEGIKKGINIRHIINTCNMLKKKKVFVFAFMMMYQIWEKDERIKVERFTDVLKSLGFIWGLRVRNCVKYMSWGYATPFHGSELYDLAKKYSLLLPNINNTCNFMPNEITLKIPKIHKILMIISRTLGLISQGIFLLFAKDLKLKGNIANHHKSVLEKIKYIIRPW